MIKTFITGTVSYFFILQTQYNPIHSVVLAGFSIDESYREVPYLKVVQVLGSITVFLRIINDL